MYTYIDVGKTKLEFDKIGRGTMRYPLPVRLPDPVWKFGVIHTSSVLGYIKSSI